MSGKAKPAISSSNSSTSVSEGRDDIIKPDGGWGWLVCLTSMATNGSVFGIINSYGILYVALKEYYEKTDPDVGSSNLALVGSICTGVTFFTCMLSSIISDRLGLRPTAIVGAVLACLGMLASAFGFQKALEILYVTYGIIMGVGFAFCYNPSLVIIVHYFKERMGLANGIVTFGSSLFTIGFTLGLPKLLNEVGIKYTLLILSGTNILMVPYAMTWKPIFVSSHVQKRLLNIDVWKIRGYVIWALSIGVSLFGYFVPFVHIVQHVKDVFPDSDGQILVMCLAITSGVSRIFFGKLADFEWANRIRIQQLAFCVMGICTICIPLSTSFNGLIVIMLIIGICDGIYICYLSPIAFDLVGDTGASQALGFLFGIISIPYTTGPPIAGFLYDRLGNYNLAFHLAGVPPIVGSLIMFFIPRTELNLMSEESAPKSTSQQDKRSMVEVEDTKDITESMPSLSPSLAHQ